MVWKQDLAKLKQAYKDVGPPPPTPQRPKSKPIEVKDIQDEDALFLNAMGGPKPQPSFIQAVPMALAPPPEPKADVSFEVGLAELKGLKPLGGHPVFSLVAEAPATHSSPAAPAEAPDASKTIQGSPLSATTTEAAPVGPEEPLAAGPSRIQLAAGMAVEVDGILDLQNHSIPDALGRLRDRIEDGALMGWRTLHVILGEDEGLHVAVLAFLSESGPKVTRYAQAPIPMGGSSAWILYY